MSNNSLSRYNKCTYIYNIAYITIIIIYYIDDLINNSKLLDNEKIEELQTIYIEELSEMESDITKSNIKQNEIYIKKYAKYLNEMKYIYIFYNFFI